VDAGGWMAKIAVSAMVRHGGVGVRFVTSRR
jgi:hypothetical protein